MHLTMDNHDDATEVVRLYHLFRQALESSTAGESIRGTALGMMVGSLALTTSDPQACFMAIGTVASQVIEKHINDSGTRH